MFVFKEKIYNYQGFTLIELLVTVAIAGILMSVGIPSFNQTIANSRLTTNANSLVTSLNIARSEAVKRNQTVSVKRIGSQWESGWTIFTDADGDGINETGDTLLRTFEALPSNYTLRGITKTATPSYTSSITYSGSGMSSGGNVVLFVLCDNSDSNNIPEAATSRVIIINSVGRVGMGSDNDNNGIPEIEDGTTDITSCTASPFI